MEYFSFRQGVHNLPISLILIDMIRNIRDPTLDSSDSKIDMIWKFAINSAIPHLIPVILNDS